MSISLFVKKLIAGIIAFLMPITSIATVQPKNVTQPTQDYHSEVIYTEYGNDENVPDEEDFDVQTPDEDKTEGQDEQQAPKQEANEPVEEEPEIEEDEDNQFGDYVAAWDVSDSNEDEVIMLYYDTDDVSLLENITAAVRALFVPITAYAEPVDDEEPQEDDGISTDNATGTVVITGYGATREFLFLKWLDYPNFVKYYEPWCAENGYEDECYIYREYIDENGNYTGSAKSADYVNRLFAGLPDDIKYEGMFDMYIPAHMIEFVTDFDNFWELCATFTPRNVIITGDVTEIGFAALAFCNTIESVTITADVQTIGAGAFVGVDIAEITLPATVKNIKASAFAGCERLAKVDINGILDVCGEDAFKNLKQGSKINCQNLKSFATVLGIDPAAIPMVMAFEDIEYEEQYSPRTTVTYTYYAL